MSIPVAFHVGEFIGDELAARGWASRDLARRMPGDPAENELAIELITAVHDPNLRLGEEDGMAMARAFGVEDRFLLNLEAAYLRSLDVTA